MTRTKPPPPAPGPTQDLAPRPGLRSWDAILDEAGYPTDCLVLDFETYFDESYHMGTGGLSTIEYIMDDRFEVLGCATLAVANGQLFPPEFVPGHVPQIDPAIFDNVTCIMQNAAFDAQILARRFNVFPKYIVDTLGLARAWNSRQKNGLERLCKDWGLKEKGETKEFSGCTFRRRAYRPKRHKGPPLQRPLLTADRLGRLSEYACNDAAREWELFTILLPRLSNPATELRLIQHTVELFTKPTLRVDFDKGAKLIGHFEDQVQVVLATAGTTAEAVSGNKSFEALLVPALEAAGDNPRKYYKAGKLGPLLAIAQDDPQLEELQKHPDERVRNLINARSAVKSWPLHIGRVESIMAQGQAAGGLMCVPLRYHGAHTGRYSGGEGINLCNLPRAGILSQMRGLLIAPEGHSLAIVDASQIEARGTAWIAGQQDVLDQWAAGKDLYRELATKLFGYPVRKSSEAGGIEAIRKRLVWARGVGKVGVLGCGYGMGADKAIAYAASQGVVLDRDTAVNLIKTYRDENGSVVAFWGSIERAFKYTARYHRSCTLPRGLRLDWSPECDVILTLPNGRELHYLQVRIREGKYGEQIEIYNDLMHKWEKTWGGGLTENIVQAFCRDILVEAMLDLEDHGYHTAHHVYDELVLVVPEAQAEYVLNAAVQALSITPKWAPGLPLAAEGHVSRAYGKG